MKRYLKPALLVKYFVLGVLLMICLFDIASMDWHGFSMAGQAFLFSLIPTFLKKFYKVRTPHLLQAGVALFMFATIFLGEVAGFYEKFWWWDLMFHGLAGIALGLVGYIILAITYRKRSVRITPLFTSIFAVSFSLAFSTLWEILEFAVDSMLNTNMQPSANDTMLDLVVGLGGAIISAYSGYRYLLFNERLGMNGIIDEGIEKNT